MDRRNQRVPQDQVAVHRRTDEKHRSGDSPDPLASATDGNHQFHAGAFGEDVRPAGSLSIVKKVRCVHQSSCVVLAGREACHFPVVGRRCHRHASAICSAHTTRPSVVFGKLGEAQNARPLAARARDADYGGRVQVNRSGKDGQARPQRSGARTATGEMAAVIARRATRNWPRAWASTRSRISSCSGVRIGSDLRLASVAAEPPRRRPGLPRHGSVGQHRHDVSRATWTKPPSR